MTAFKYLVVDKTTGATIQGCDDLSKAITLVAELLREGRHVGVVNTTTKSKEDTVKKTPAPAAALVKLEKMTPEEIAEITALLEKNILPNLRPDVSNYAKGRQRVWLPYEAPLGNQSFNAGLLDGEVWQWIVDRCAKHGFKAQVALISRGGNIKPHRDTTFAAPWAMGFNLGKCDWHIASDRASSTPDYTMNLNGGEVFKFNSKHTHAVTNASEDRWAINVWAIADGPAAKTANIPDRLKQMLDENPEIQEFIDLHIPGSQTKKEAPMSTPKSKSAPNPVAKTPQGSATVKMTPSGGGNIVEYLVDMAIPILGVPGHFSTTRIVTNDPDYWLKHDNAVVIEQVDRGGYHYALLEHLFGHTSFAVNLTSYNDPMMRQPTAQVVFTHSPVVPKDSIFGWANFDSETIIRVKGHGHKGWSNMSQFGLHVGNSEKMTKRLVEIAKASRGYKVNAKANGDRMLKILVLTHDQILRAFPSLEDEYYAEKGFDGVSVMAVEKAKDVYRNNVHMPKRATARLLNQIDNLEVTNHTLRILTNVDGVAGEIKGNVLTGKRAKINARLVELGLSDGKISYDVVTSVDNFKKELGTDGSWEIITLEPHHGPGMVKTNDQTLAQFQGIPGIFSFDEILEAFQTVLDDYGDKIKSGKDVEWIKNIRSERPVTEADTFNQLRGSMNKDLMHIYGVYNDLGLDIGTNQTLTHMRITFLKKMFLSQIPPQGMNWKASSKEKKSFMFMPWAYRAYVMTKEVIYLAGYDIDLKNTNCGYHKETQTFAMPGKLWGDVCVKLGGADLDDEVMVHIRKFVELDGSERLGALLIRTPNDWAEYAIVDVKVPGPVFVNKLDMPTVNMKDLVKFKQSSKCGKLPSKVNGSQRPNPPVWDYTCARYNYLISTNIVGGVGGQVKVKMLRYAIYDKPFNTLPCPNEDMIDAIQQCKGDANDLTTLRRWADREIYNLLTGKAMDAYWFYSRKMGKTADALNITPTSFISADRSPIVRDLMVPREEMILDLYRELDDFLKRQIHEIEEIKDIFDSKDQEWTYRKRVMKIVKDNRSKSLDDAATDILDRFIAFENANGIEATNLLILRMVRASYLVKKDMGGANWDNWLVAVVPNSDLQVIDFFYRAMVWHRKRKSK